MPEEEQEEAYIHGSMFYLMKEFILSSYDEKIWVKLTKKAGTVSSHDPHSNYPAADMFLIVRGAAEHAGLANNTIMEMFGEHLVPRLLSLYKAHIRPEWKIFQMLENTELVMHKAVRKQENEAAPPILNVSRVHDKLLIIDYFSKRKMASLGIGIIKGIAKFYNESEKVKVISMSNENDERVQIRIEFK